jgi:hypothetical protein
MPDATTSQIFVGGWRNTGTRLVCRLLRHKGYDSLEHLTNPMLDYRGAEFRSLFKALKWFGDHSLVEKIRQDTRGIERWVVKHGHLMLMVPLLKEEFPQSKFVCCVRDPLDMIAKGDDINYLEFGVSHSPSPPTLEKLATIRGWYETALPHVDLLLKLEDMLFDTPQALRNLFRCVGCDDNLTPEVRNVIGPPSPTVGGGRGQFGSLETASIAQLAARLGYGSRDDRGDRWPG